MEFNTSTLGYKLLSGKLIENRKHSEQLNKYLAGLIDSDGSFHLYFSKDRVGEYRTYCFLNVHQSDRNDPQHEMMIALRSFYDIGVLSFFTREENSPMCVWKLASKETKKLTNLIKKHLRIKGTHLDNLLWLQDELKGVPLREEHIEELKEFSKCSRRNSRWSKHPKHPSWAWLAGYLAGDGHFRCRLNRQVFDKRNNRLSYHNQLYIQVASHMSDKFLLDFLALHLGGSVSTSRGYPKWTKGLGKSSENSALPLLKQLRKYMCMRKKYVIIERMIEFHELNRSQRLNELKAKA